MKIHLLVESNRSATMLAKLLGAEQEAGLVEIRAAWPSSSLYSGARTLLAVRGEPVALLVDADSTDPEAVSRRRTTVEEVVGEVAGAAPLSVLVAVPALEALLFLRPDPVSRAFGKSASDEHTLELGRLNPREALKRLDPGGVGSTASLKLINTLDDGDISELRSTPPIRELLEFLRDVQCSEIAAISTT